MAPISEPYLFPFLFTISSLDSGLLFPLLLFCMFHVRYDKTLEVEVNSIYVQKRYWLSFFQAFFFFFLQGVGGGETQNQSNQ